MTTLQKMARTVRTLRTTAAARHDATAARLLTRWNDEYEAFRSYGVSHDEAMQWLHDMASTRMLRPLAELHYQLADLIRGRG